MVNKNQTFGTIKSNLIYHCLFVFIILSLLFSCTSHVIKKDGPPNFYVDEKKIPNAIPRPEPLSRFGNKPSYVVFGHRYHVMRTRKKYDQIGIASWYGTKFHSRYTSSGERYNMLSMTAAHKTLPLPTYVEVTNLTNNRKIIVKVNDRGPFAPNRIIDLSYVAAKKLAMLGKGTAVVRVRAIDLNRPYFKRSLFARHHLRRPENHLWLLNNQMYLQVGAFHDRLNAIKLQRRLALLLSTPVKILPPHYPVQLYRVKVGPFTDMASADKVTQHLRILGIKTILESSKSNQSVRKNKVMSRHSLISLGKLDTNMSH